MLENTQCLPSWTSEQINHYNLLVYCCALLNNFFSLWILPVATSHSGWQGLNSKHEHLSSFGLGHSTWTSDFLCLGAVWGIRAWSNPPLASILASSTDLKRIQTPHSLFTDFGADTTFTTWWQSSSLSSLSLKPLPITWQSLRLSLPKSIPEDN